jgi:phage-related protein
LTAKPLHFIGSCKDDLSELPDDVKSSAGYALWLAQIGTKHPKAKPLQGFKGASVQEVVIDEDGDSYRVVYTVRFEHAVYGLHAFQKKSKKGIETPQKDIELVRQRLGAAAEHHRKTYEKGEDK